MGIPRCREDVALDMRKQLSSINEVVENLYGDFNPVRVYNEMQRLRSLVGQLESQALLYMRARA